jgi:uncharacterized protein YkwD
MRTTSPRTRTRRVLGIVAVAAIAIAASACVPPPPPPPAQAAPGIVTQMNTLRGGAPLADNADLTGIAAEWASHLAATGVMAHRDLNQIGGWSHVGETIVAASCGISDAAVVDLWLHSPPHASIMLSPMFTNVGVARACASDGREWIVANYGG